MIGRYLMGKIQESNVTFAAKNCLYPFTISIRSDKQYIALIENNDLVDMRR